jgi:transcriptional regulator with XRE-family HTH domain
MRGDFGKFIETRRKSLGKTLRGLAAELDIAPAFMSDIEKGHRYPPAKEKLEEMARILQLSREDTNTMFDLAAGERDNGISPDLPEYIMGMPKARTALRMARDKGVDEKVWQKVIDLLEKEENKY